MRHALVTGGAGFIGSHLAEALLAEGWRVTAADHFRLDELHKQRNINRATECDRYSMHRCDIRHWSDFGLISRMGPYDVIVHLAALAGVRPSIADPLGYQDTNVRGTQHVLEFARAERIPHVVFASSSSVYGDNPFLPWAEDEELRPISHYASTKISGELLGRVYSHLFGIRFVALRFFTVYGPRQRPDLAIHKFARQMLAGEPIEVYGDGSTSRDYTYIDDIVRGIRAAMDYTASPHEVFNLGNRAPIRLSTMVEMLARALDVKPRIRLKPEQRGDVRRTWADIKKAQKLLGYNPTMRFEEGIGRFAVWLKSSIQDAVDRDTRPAVGINYEA